MPSYWEQRAIDSIGRMESAVNGALPELIKSFEAARRDLNDAVYRFYGRYAKNNTITLDEARQELSLLELREFRGDLGEYEQLARESIGTFSLEVDNLSVKARITRLEALETQCDAILQNLYQEQKRQIEGTAARVYTEEYYRRLFDIEQYTGFQFQYSQIPTDTIAKVLAQPVQGADISTRLWRQDIDTGFRIRQTLNTMFVTGRPPQDFADDLQKMIGAIRTNPDGTPGGTGKKFEAYRLLYNESAHVVNQAHLQAYRDDGLEEYENVATLDKATCDICAPQDGKHYPVEKAVEGVNHPSFHVNCRCTTAPYINLKAIYSTRMARDTVTEQSVRTSEQTYEKWRAAQDAKYSAGLSEYSQIQGAGIRRTPDIDTFQKQRYNNSPDYQSLMQRLANVQGNGDWKAVEFNPQTSDSHFEKHGADFGVNNIAEYKAAALKFVNDASGKEAVIASDGIRRFYSRETNEFASVYPDGTISTYYKPRSGEKYWKGQVEKYGTK